MELLNEIREGLASIKHGKVLEIEALKESAPAWIVRDKGWFGTAVEFPFDRVIFEKFSNVRLWTRTLTMEGESKSMLLLTSNREELRYEFASLCAEFCEPGRNNEQRKMLLSEPVEWWKKWRELLGNAVSDKKVYAVIAEMIIFEELLRKNPNTKWMALNSATHDIVSNDISYEVKSTIKRYESLITINSQYQLEEDNVKLSIVFCRFEPAPKGVSINVMIERLINIGCSRKMIEEGLDSMGFEYGRSARDETYKILEVLEFPVDEEFPKITSNKFKDERIPIGIETILYVVNLSLVTNSRPFQISHE